MRIIVVGLGKVGELLTDALAQERHDLMVIDANAGLVNDIVNRYDVYGIVGNGANPDILRQAIQDGADMLIAVTSADEVNILVGMIGKHMGVKNIICRVRNPDYAKLSTKEFGFAMIANPELEAAREIFRILMFPSASHIETFAKGAVELVGMKITRSTLIVQEPLKRLPAFTRAPILICVVLRGREVLIPGGDFVLRPGDEIYVTGKHGDITRFAMDIGLMTQSLKQIMIVGGSRIAYYLCTLLQGQNVRVKIIEKDENRALELARNLPGAVIIGGDGSDIELLVEEGIDNTDGLIGLTGMDEENIVLALLARQREVKKSIIKINNTALAQTIATLDLDTTISPKELIANHIIAYVRSCYADDEAILTVYRLMDGAVEAVELVVTEKARCLGQRLSDLPLKQGILIAAVLRNNDVLVPRGNTVIAKDDHLIVIAHNSRIVKMSDLYE